MTTEKMTSPDRMSYNIDAIASALSKAQAEVGRVIKNEETKNNPKFNYTYATLDAVMEVVKPVLSANGLAIVQCPDETHLHTILVHTSGQWIDYGKYPLGHAEKHQDRGSALTYARRYTITAIFGIAPQNDDDGEAGNNSLGNPPPPKKNFITAAERNRFCDNVIKAFEGAITLEDLKKAADAYDSKFKEMDAGEDFDKLAVEELRKRYKKELQRLAVANGLATTTPAQRRTVEAATGRRMAVPNDLNDDIPEQFK